MTEKTRRSNETKPYEFDFFDPLFRVFFRVLVLIVIIAVFFAAILSIISIPFMYYNNPFWNLFGALVAVLFALWILSWFFGRRYNYRVYAWHSRWSGQSNAEEILKARYAKGEISKKEFEDRMKELTRFH